MSGSGDIPRVLSIAGSDSGGGAGIQADLKAFAACDVYGMTAITAITAQNTVGVRDVHHVPPETIVEQVRAVAQDIGIDAVKIGMLGTVATIEAVEFALSELPAETPVVIDPVMVAESGAQLLEDAARAALAERLLPRATVVTPNVPEARVLAGAVGVGAGGAGAAGAAGAGADTSEPEWLARAVHALGPRYVVVTGGHRELAIDVFFDGSSVSEISGPATPLAPLTAPGARTPRFSRRGWPGGTRRSRRRGWRRNWRRGRWPTGSSRSVPGPGRSTSSGSGVGPAGERSRRRRRLGPESRASARGAAGGSGLSRPATLGGGDGPADRGNFARHRQVLAACPTPSPDAGSSTRCRAGRLASDLFRSRGRCRPDLACRPRVAPPHGCDPPFGPPVAGSRL